MLDELHGDIGHALELAELIDAADTGMVEFRSDFGFPEETEPGRL